MQPADLFESTLAPEGITVDFPSAVSAEVAAYVDKPGIDDATLVDLVAVPFVTIDGPGTRDLDQAVHVEKSATGFRLRYAIADASYYVAPGTALFDEAVRRGASFYVPGASVPMLPRKLSEDLVSLGPNVERRALVFDVTFDLRGTIVKSGLVRARVKSRAKLAFEDVDAFVDSSKGPFAAEAYAESLRATVELGELRLVHEDRKTMIRYRRAEAETTIDAKGNLVTHTAPRGRTEVANEQISILCNALGARFLLGGSEDIVQPIYRVHSAPDPERVAGFERLVGAVAKTRGLPDDPWVYRRAADLGISGYLASLPTAGAPGRLARALHRQAMLLNGRSMFAGDPSGHFGVGEAVYSRFTAPMREIVGVFCHAQALERMVGRAARPRDIDLAIRERVIDAGNRSKDLQRRIDRDVSRWIITKVLGPDAELPVEKRPARAATIMGFSNGKAHLLLDDPPIDVIATFHELSKSLGGAWLEVRDEGSRLALKNTDDTVVRLGDEVKARAATAELVTFDVDPALATKSKSRR
ncbi:MAG TPA: RNB domain-containing ribonuclease [Polyangiaceae bacterium]|nr:RNB domain-containing ribonuclease [Polyangiaceae bacterium]